MERKKKLLRDSTAASHHGDWTMSLCRTEIPDAQTRKKKTKPNPNNICTIKHQCSNQSAGTISEKWRVDTAICSGYVLHLCISNFIFHLYCTKSLNKPVMTCRSDMTFFWQELRTHFYQEVKTVTFIKSNQIVALIQQQRAQCAWKAATYRTWQNFTDLTQNSKRSIGSCFGVMQRWLLSSSFAAAHGSPVRKTSAVTRQFLSN